MIVILGGGPAGRTAAIHLATQGADVLMVEHGGIGGQCLNYGCMVVCALNDTARALQSSAELVRLGIFDREPALDYPALIRGMIDVQAKIRGILDKETRDAGVEIRYGIRGRLDGQDVILGSERLRPDAAIVATGSRPNIPDIPGISLEGVITPHTLAGIPRLPERLTIIGGGVMAAEFAHIFSAFGSHVDLVCRSGFLRSLDPVIRTMARRDLAPRVTIHEHAAVTSVHGNSRVESVTYMTRDEETRIPADTVLIAAGLVPRSEDINGVEKGPGGEVIVNPHMQTSIPHIYAAGDVTGPPCLTPVARREGYIAAENILGHPLRMGTEFIPQAMNLSLEYAFCGHSTPESVAFKIPGPAGPGTFWKVPAGETGLSRVKVQPGDGQLTFAVSASPAGGISASYLAFLMQGGVTAKDFERFIEVHPMADGMYWLLKYAAHHLERKKESRVGERKE